ncbi:hypothetical protein E6W26_19400 [Pseudomonas aeruginosa]|uniref:hypothetical protein n=1 Tax=Pseudomonas aeruginosa TaxID=287 RepID=UPI00109E1D06|nr:hypothetical protein [Pseudomonas aeruginosa]EKV1239515.1 hypothetical protein [Pseudomonas aeruginosa]EKV8587809.1 hypothetical protein [Pseudomonas aeruginosa]ELN5409871.1 hypothetical protein [Pseudomonas aeruginosa]ELP1434983.1 hypothetical protein [Pseudomonas aeruginosa]THB19473.1 hypothetical protein E6W26_19400 [Pseudomonas aeruginosa]
MKNLEHRFSVKNAITEETEFEFEGTYLNFAKLLSETNPQIHRVGYPKDLIAEYRNDILNDVYSDSDLTQIERLISSLENLDNDHVASVSLNDGIYELSKRLEDINNNLRIQKSDFKHPSVNNVEALGYSIKAVSGKGGTHTLQLIEDGQCIGRVDVPSNFDLIAVTRSKLAGFSQVTDDSHLDHKLNSIYTVALAHSMANDRIAPEKIESLVAKLPEHLQNEYSRRLDGFGSQVDKVAAPEPEHFYLIRSSVKSPRDNTVTSFTNEFIGTAAGLEEYRQDVQRRNSSYKPEYRPVWNEVEKFAPEFREQHRTIEALIQAYKAGTGNKGKMKEAFDKFDQVAKDRLDFRLKEENLNPDKFKNDLKSDEDGNKNKRIRKPRM